MIFHGRKLLMIYDNMLFTFESNSNKFISIQMNDNNIKMKNDNNIQTKESPYIHRYTRYLKDLEECWAYKDTNRTPGKRKRNKSKKKSQSDLKIIEQS